MSVVEGFLAQPDDLTQLRIIDAAAVRQLVETINATDNETLKQRKLVIVIGTGGTLAMKTDHLGVRAPHYDIENVFNYANPRIHQRFNLHCLSAFNIDSSQMTYQHVRELAVTLTFMMQNLTVPHIGFVIFHGTDTMSYTGAALSLMTGQGLPCSIVLTGAQKPIHEPLTDAARNISNALYTLEALAANDMAEVLIVMGNRAMLATSAEKVDDTSADAFATTRHEYVATFDRMEYPVRLAGWLNQRRKVAFEPTIWPTDYSHTLVVKSTMGLDPMAVARMVAFPETLAVIFYSYGAGTVHELVLDAVMIEARQKKIPVFIVNPVHSDFRVEYDSSAKAVRAGAVPLDMTLSAALAKMEIALRLHPGDTASQAIFMTQSYVGEIATTANRKYRQ